jgi:hypothetical protein
MVDNLDAVACTLDSPTFDIDPVSRMKDPLHAIT